MFVDGDGADKIGRILLNGEDVTEMKPGDVSKLDQAIEKMDALQQRLIADKVPTKD